MKEDKLDKVVKAVVKAIDERMNKKPKSYYTEAEVLRVDKGSKTAYVHIPGGVDQTPASLTIDAKKGDTVQVRVGEGKAFIVGNVTNPPSDNEVAEQAKQEASSALSHSLEAVVDDTMFYLASDQDTGVTVEDEGWTEEPQEPTALLPYLWVYHRYTKGSGSTFYSDPMIIAVYTEDGVGITAIQPQYYLSTSSSSAVGGSWSNSLTYLSGYYIWTRDMITYSDGTTGYSTAIYDQALTEACSLSYNSAQYFWTKTSSNYTSCPTGSYVTEVSRDHYDPDKGGTVSGGSLLLRSAGIYIRNAATTVAQFLAAGVTLFNAAGQKMAEFVSSGVNLYKNGVKLIEIIAGQINYCDDDGNTAASSVYSSDTFGTHNFSNICGYGNSYDYAALALRNNKYGNKMGEAALTTAWGDSNNYGDTTLFMNKNQFSVEIDEDGGYGPFINLTTAYGFTVGTNQQKKFEVDPATGKAKLGALDNGIFTTTSVSLSQSNATAGNNYEIESTPGQTGTSKTGYYPLGVVGYSVATNGTYSRGVYLSSQSDGACTVKARIYADTAGDKTCTVKVLWLKTTA